MLTHFICPDGEKTLITDCLAKCRLDNRCLARPLLCAAGESRPWLGMPSVTQLIAGTRESYLKIVKDYAIVPTGTIMFMILGTYIHNNLSKAGPEELAEERLSLHGITGKFDNYSQEGGVPTLTDFKVCGAYAVKKAMGLVYRLVEGKEIYKKKTTLSGPDGERITREAGQNKLVKEWDSNADAVDDKSYRLQLNMYGLMLIAAGFPVEKLQVMAIIRDGGLRAAQTMGVAERAKLIDIPIMPEADVLAYFLPKRDALLSALKNEQMPPMCSDEESWNGRKCEECVVRSACLEGAKQ